MTTKTLTGTIATGYSLSAAYSALLVTANATITGTAGQNLTGKSNGGGGGAGVYLAPFVSSRTVTNTGAIKGGTGGQGYNGGNGGVGLSIASQGSLANSGSIIGGAGGAGASGAGGVGGVGVYIAGGGSLYNAGSIAGGAGGGGVNGFSAGGAGALLAKSGVVNNVGAISGGVGGDGLIMFGGTVTNGIAGMSSAGISGSNGIYSSTAGVAVTNFATIKGTTLNGVALISGGTIINGSASSTSAVIYGVYAGVYVRKGFATVTNFGVISGAAAEGVVLGSGGNVANGTTTTTQSLISGLFDGIYAYGTRDATVTNFGTVQGQYSDGLLLAAGGTVTNGGSSNTKALIEGYFAGVYVAARLASVANFGTIIAAVSEGIFIGGGGQVVNGSATSTSALISGEIGVYVAPAVATTVTNFGTIRGTSGTSVLFASVNDCLIAEAGSTFIGSVQGHGGVLELGGGSGTVTGLGQTTTISGATALTASGFGSYAFDGNGAWTIAGATSLSPSLSVSSQGTLIVNGALTSLYSITDAAGLFLAGSSTLTNGAQRWPNARISGSIGVYAGPGGAATVTNFGTITGSAGTSVRFKSANDLLVVEAGSSFIGVAQGGGGTLALAGGIGGITGIGSTGTISGAAALTFSGFGSYLLGPGGAWTLSGTNTLTSSQSFVVSGSMTNVGRLAGGPHLTLAACSVTNGGSGNSNALISAVTGVYGRATGGSTVTNFGTIQGTSGTSVRFNSSTDRLIAEAGSTFLGSAQGGGGTLELAGGTATITGLGSIGAVSGAEALTFSGFGSYVLDASGTWKTTGTNSLAAGQSLTLAGSLFNTGTITDGTGNGVSLAPGGSLSNGGAGSGAALISGIIGVYAGAAGSATTTNFGTIQGTGGTSVQFGSTSDRLIVEPGSTFVGAAQGGGGTLEIAGGNGAITGLGGAGTLSGATALSFGGFGSYAVDSGASWSLTGANSLKPGATLAVFGALSLAGTLYNSGSVSGAAGSTLALNNGDLIGGLLQSATPVGVNGTGNILDGTSGALINNSMLVVSNGSGLTLQGMIINSGAIGLSASTSITRLMVGKAGVTLSGHGAIILGSNAANLVTGAAAGAVLINVDNTISGAGAIGGNLSLTNQAAGVIEQTGALALTISSQTKLTNAGTIKASGTGGVTISGVIYNRGTLEANGGNMTVNGAVSGAGGAIINAGTLNFASSFNEDVTFSGTTGELILAQSRTYTQRISGFSVSGGTSFDLRDIAFVSPGEATFSGTTKAGVLTVTDGTHTAKINLRGNYLGSNWVASSDGRGGVLIVDPGAASTAQPSPHAFISALATTGATVSVATQFCSGGALGTTQPLFCSPR